MSNQNKPSILYNSNSESFDWKIYNTDETFLKSLAKKYDLLLDYAGEGVGEGYVSDVTSLRVFGKSSIVDEDYMLTTLYKEDYL